MLYQQTMTHVTTTPQSTPILEYANQSSICRACKTLDQTTLEMRYSRRFGSETTYLEDLLAGCSQLSRRLKMDRLLIQRCWRLRTVSWWTYVEMMRWCIIHPSCSLRRGNWLTEWTRDRTYYSFPFQISSLNVKGSLKTEYTYSTRTH